MQILFVQPQPCIRALKYAESLRQMYPDIRLFYAYEGKTLNGLYGHGDEHFDAWYALTDNPGKVLQDVVRKENIDLIHSHNAPDHLTNLCIDLFAGQIPIINDIHDLMSARNTVYEDGIDRDQGDWRQLEQRAIEQSDAVITVSEQILTLAKKAGYQLPAICQVFGNYIPERFIPSQIPVNGSLEDRPPRIVYEGFLSSNGSHYDFREAFQGLANQGFEVHIYASRHNSDYAGLDDANSNITYHAHLPPEKLFEELVHYDFGWAGFNASLNRVHIDTALPNKLFEYIACGLPVISFAHEAIEKFLTQHRLGIVIDEISDLRPALQNTDLPALRERVVEHRRHFTIERNLPDIVGLYRDLVGDRQQTEAFLPQIQMSS